ncbi:tyrosine-type recombinase/integrase [Streptomyces viridochromogenes]|uniref:tyrosine-type recombinase/integrase n=1 Tax=Streptomyces viridochromogenes TaxID=1938 RepID=UPI00099DB00F|nr:site-specific integrase [Streptomyces viridochromogenes]
MPGHIEDRWVSKRTRKKTKLYGKGKRYKVAGIPGVRARSFTKLTDAKQWLAHAQTDMTRQEFVDPREGTILLRSYVEEQWWPHQRYAATTRDAARRRIWGHVLPTLGPLPLNAITAPALREWVAQLEETLSPGTIRTTWGHLSTILQAAVEDGRLVKHPMKGSRTARPPAKPAQKARAWSREQAMRVRAGLPEQYRLAVDLGVGLGLRQGEAFGLSPEDLDMENGVVHVRRQVCMIEGHLFFALPKGGKTREVDVAPGVLTAIKQHAKRWQPVAVELPWESPHEPKNDRQRVDWAPRTYPLFLATRQRRAWNRDTWNRRLWKPALASAGLIGKVDPNSDGSKWEPSRELGFHALRHTYASVQLEAGESVVSLARWLGHADPGFTLRTYTHFMPDAGRRGRAAMDAWFSGEANSLETP